ncbi:unnamed protein product [Pseudo-nitzschia multistriata]|uniref:Uncharacterized protein n=1 Tax=Pseudo-nitzschia multistriata TaxID=183589 RepID=A0A448Z1I6_9STRA|nr:unnamed protein product [Pseudo-nitzschia multistriata]
MKDSLWAIISYGAPPLVFRSIYTRRDTNSYPGLLLVGNAKEFVVGESLQFESPHVNAQSIQSSLTHSVAELPSSNDIPSGKTPIQSSSSGLQFSKSTTKTFASAK